MEEIQRKLTQRYEGAKQRKVRFKLASSYSGRVLKHVYEDGQELDSPEEKYPHSFLHRKLPPSHLELEQLCGFQEGGGPPPTATSSSEDPRGGYPPTGLIAQRINVYRGTGGYKPALSQDHGAGGDPNSSVLDFGKIIIYTSNLRIIRAPPPQNAPATPPQNAPDTPPRRSAAAATHEARSHSGGRRRRSRRSPSSPRDGGPRRGGRRGRGEGERQREREEGEGEAIRQRRGKACSCLFSYGCPSVFCITLRFPA
ncbi:hypothetical protein NHX12_010656, partial [Muraenolepis orangiensis]